MPPVATMENPAVHEKFMKDISKVEETAKTDPTVAAALAKVVREVYAEHQKAIADHLCGQSLLARIHGKLCDLGLIKTE